MKLLRRAVAAAVMLALLIAVLPVIPAVSAESVAKTAYRMSTDGTQIQLISAVDSLNYQEIGFEVTAKDSENGSVDTVLCDNIVYTSIVAVNGTFTSADFGIENGYVFVLVINSVPENTKITAKSFATDMKGEKHMGSKTVITIGETEDDGAYPIAENNYTARLDQIDIKDQDGDGVIRVACLGDSITAGNEGNNWPLYLSRALEYLGTVDGNTYEVHNHGKGGAAVHHVEEQVGDPNWGWGTVDDTDGDGKAYFYYDDRAFTSIWTYTPDVVLIQFGTNDGDYKSYLKDDYYTWLVKPFLDQGAQIVMATPTYACNGIHDGRVNGDMHDYEVAMAEEWGFPLIDLNRFLWDMPEVFADGLHGNATGYNMMANIYYKYVFGGELVTATFETQPGATIRLIDTSDNANYIRTADADGLASISFIPSREYNFVVNIDLNGFESIRDSVTLSATDTFSFPMKAGGVNIAVNGTGIDCGVKVYGDNVAANLNDGERTSGGYQPDSWNEGDWCGLEFADAYTVDKFVLYWETAAYISSYEDGGFEIYLMLDGSDDWTLVDPAETTSKRLPFSGDVVSDEIELNSAKTIKGIKVVFKNGKISDHKFAPKLYELEVFEA